MTNPAGAQSTHRSALWPLAVVSIGFLTHLAACPGPTDRSPTAADGHSTTRSGDPARTTVREHARSEAATRALVERSAGLLRSMARILRSTASDCDALATALGSWLDRHDQQLAALLEEMARIPTATRAELMREAIGTDPVISQAATSLDACGGHPGVEAAVKRIGPGL